MDETTVPTSLSNRKRPERDVRLMVILFIAVVALATVIVLLVMYVVGQFRRESLITTQRACLEFQLPAETVVYEEESARAAQLIARGGVAGGEYVRTRAGEGPPIAAYVPRVWRELLKGASITRPSDFSNDAVLFLHERTTNNGNHVITCVEADRRTRRLRVTLIEPGGASLEPVLHADLAILPQPQEGLILIATPRRPLRVAPAPRRRGTNRSRRSPIFCRSTRRAGRNAHDSSVRNRRPPGCD